MRRRDPNPLFNQADTVVTIETDAGITGIGEGGFPDTLRQCAGRLIGQDPQHIERLWQDMSRSFFYPPGREKEDALGALDLALWDIRGKVLKLPVHEILGGTTRNYCECYNTGGAMPGIKPGMSLKDRAAATIAAGLPRLPHGGRRYARQRDLQHARKGKQALRGLRPGSGRRR